MSPKLLIVLLLLSSGVMYYLLISPLYTGSGDLWSPQEGGVLQLIQKKAQYEKAINDADNIIKQANELKNDYAKVTNEDKEKLRLMIPETIDRVRLLSEMSNMTNMIGLTVKDMAVSESLKPTASSLGVYTISFNFSTSYPHFKELVRKFETNLRLFRLESASFNPSEKESDPISFKLRFSTFYMK